MKLEATEEIIKEILARHDGKHYSQCLKCGSINSDAKELIKTLCIIRNEAALSEDEHLDELNDYCDALLKEMIEVGAPDFRRDNEFFNEWFKERESRFSQELSDDFGDTVHFKNIQNIVLKTDDKCDCFKSFNP